MGQRSAVCRLAIAVSTVVCMMLSAGAFTPIDAQQFSGTLRGTGAGSSSGHQFWLTRTRPAPAPTGGPPARCSRRPTI